MTKAQYEAHRQRIDEAWKYEQHLRHKRLFNKYLTIKPSKEIPTIMHICYKGWSIGCFFNYKWDQADKRKKLDVAYSLLEAIEMKGWDNGKSTQV